MSESVRFIHQREEWDCGVAALAMAAGLTYDDTLKAVPAAVIEYAKINRGISTAHIPAILGGLGIATRCRFVKEGSAWWDDGLLGLRLCDVSGHFIIVRPDGLVNDPARGEGLPIADYPQAFQVWEIHPRPAPPSDEVVARVDQRDDGCWPACIATITGLSLDVLPHPTTEELTREAWSDYHNRLLMTLHGLGWTLLDLGQRIPLGLAIASGIGPRDLGHSVIVKDGELWHDPHPSRQGLETCHGYEIVVPVCRAWTARDEEGRATDWRWVRAVRAAEREAAKEKP